VGGEIAQHPTAAVEEHKHRQVPTVPAGRTTVSLISWPAALMVFFGDIDLE
jgi:hypothetical protein